MDKSTHTFSVPVPVPVFQITDIIINIIILWKHVAILNLQSGIFCGGESDKKNA